MPLTEQQVDTIHDAIEGYNFPCVYYDFNNECEVIHENMLPVEESIKNDLISGITNSVKNGLSNVLYWGYADIGYRDTRVSIFRNKATPGKLQDAAFVFRNQEEIDLIEIKNINLPQFSGMSFISKIAMFLNPKDYAILDLQILKMNDVEVPTVLNEITFGINETQIRISQNNFRVYKKWCRKCSEISRDYFNSFYRAVDIERGFFTLIKSGHINQAANILSNA